MLVSYDFNILYPSGQIKINSTWLKTETADPFKKHIIDAVCASFNRGRWNELNRYAFLTVKYHNLENLIFEHLPVKKILKTQTKTIEWKRLMKWEMV